MINKSLVLNTISNLNIKVAGSGTVVYMNGMRKKMKIKAYLQTFLFCTLSIWFRLE